MNEWRNSSLSNEWRNSPFKLIREREKKTAGAYEKKKSPCFVSTKTTVFFVLSSVFLTLLLRRRGTGVRSTWSSSRCCPSNWSDWPPSRRWSSRTWWRRWSRSWTAVRPRFAPSSLTSPRVSTTCSAWTIFSWVEFALDYRQKFEKRL